MGAGPKSGPHPRRNLVMPALRPALLVTPVAWFCLALIAWSQGAPVHGFDPARVDLGPHPRLAALFAVEGAAERRAAVLEGLEGALVDGAVRGDTSQTRRRIEELLLVLMHERAVEGRAELLALLLARLGELESVVKPGDPPTLLPHPDSRRWSDLAAGFVPAGPLWLAAVGPAGGQNANAASAAARASAPTPQAQAAVAVASEQSSEKGLADWVLTQLHHNRVNEIARLGSHGLEVLVELTREHGFGGSQDTAQRAVNAIVHLYPADGAGALAELVEAPEGARLVPLVERWLQERLRLASTYYAESEEEPARFRWADGGAAQLLAAVLLHPEAIESVGRLLDPVFQRDALLAEHEARLSAALGGESEDRALRTFRLFEFVQYTRAELPLLEAALASPHGVIRRRAAQRLVLHPASAALFDLAEDEDPEVRRAVLDAFRSRTVSFHFMNARGLSTRITHDGKSARAEHPESAARALAVLLGDPAPDLRERARRSLDSSNWSEAPFLLEAVLESAREGSAADRVALLELRFLPSSWRASLIETLAADGDPAVREARLAALTRLDPAEVLAIPGVSPDEVLAHVAAVGARETRNAWLRSGEVLEATLAWAFAEPGARRIDRLIEGTALSRHQLSRQMEDEALVAWIRASAAAGEDPEASSRALGLVGFIVGDRRVAAARSVLRDTGFDARLRLYAAGIALQAGEGEVLAELLRTLAKESPGPTEEERARLHAASRSLPGSELAEMLARLIREPGLSAEWLAGPFAVMPVDGEHAVEAARGALERWTPGDSGSNLIFSHIMNRLWPRRPDLLTIGFFERATAHPPMAHGAVQALGTQQLEGAVELLTTVLADGPEGAYEESTQVAAVHSLERIAQVDGDPRTVEALLLALDQGSVSLRSAAREALERLDQLYTLRDSWRRRLAQGPAREEAMAALRAFLSDPDPEVRVEAVRGLGSLGTALDIPTLIPLLRDPEPQMRAAARASLDRLHARADNDG